LLIRPFLPTDLEVVNNLGGEFPASHREWLDWTVLSYHQLALLHQPPYGDRAVELKGVGQSRGTVVGAAGLVPSLGPFGQLPSFGGLPCHNTPEIGLFYAISPDYRRQGFASEAAQVLIDYAFSVLDLARIVATTTFDNDASQGVMRKLSMRVEQNPYPDPPWFQVVGILENPL
jgi:RimJ/RimL family protein N-acetyltransferase